MHLFTINVKQILLPCLLVGTCFLNAVAQVPDSSAAKTQDSLQRVTDNRLKVTGIIKEASTGKPLDGISISVPGYSASITEEDGSFSIAVPDYDAALIISGEGFHTKEVALKGRSSVNTILYEENYKSLYDAVNLPYGNKLYSHTAGAVKSVNTTDRWQRVSESPDTYLQGRVPGLNSVRRSGTPGVGSSVFVRGTNSLSTSNQPLYVIDGIYYDNNDYGISLLAGHVENPLANIDLKDIDNITVIKDATASTYGTKAANGVVLITTARAKDQATRIDFATYGGYNVKPSNIPVMNAAQYRTYLSDALGGYLNTPGIDPYTAATLRQNSELYLNDDPTNVNYYRYHYDTDWQKQVIGGSYNQNYYMKVTGGDNIATYGLSVGYLNNQGITKNTDLQRYQTRFNADLNLTEKFKGSANLSFVSNQQNLKDQGLAYNTNPIYLALTKAPFLPAFEVSDNGTESPNYADVDIFNKSNPASAIEDMQGSTRNYRLRGSIGFSYAFNKELKLSVLGGVTFSKVRETIFVPQKGIVSDTLTQSIATKRSGTNVERLYSLFNDTRLSYNKTFNNTHNFSANVGFRFNDNKMETDYGLGFNSATDDFVSVGNGQAALRQISGLNGSWRDLNVYANADYEFRNKYFVSFNTALDGSSRFGKDASGGLALGGNTFAVLPSIAAGWLISSEPFLAGSNLFELLKLRASYGLVGNDDIGNYTSKRYYVSQNFLGFQGLVRGNVANTALKWETVRKMNLGLDASFLKERLNVSLDLFHHKTSDMITQEPLATITGFDFVLANNGEMENKGIELGINGRILNKSVKWDMGVNVSAYRNKITRIPDDRLITNYAGATILTQKGMASNLFYGYKTNGIYASDAEASASNLAVRRADGTLIALQGGDVRFVNTNNDAFIDENDMQVIGNPNPDFTGMISNMVSWKRFSMDAILTFSVGNDVYNFMRRNLESMNSFQNQSPRMINRWRVDGQVTEVPRAVIGDPAANSRFSDRWIEDGSYLRLRTLSVTYDVPLKAKALKYARVYLSGNNLFTIAKYLGYDPEFSAGESVFTQGIDTGLEPQFRTIQLGVRVGL